MSLSSSATFLPSATVLIITPKPLGLILSINLFNLFFSSVLFSFWEIDTLSENGMRTIYLPAKDSSDDTLGPLEEMASFEI